MLRASFQALVVLASLGTQASADHPKFKLVDAPGIGTPVTTAGQLAGHVIFLNNCPGGCTIVPGADDATAQPPKSMIIQQQSTLSEFTGFQPGEWAAIVQCVKEVYSPFNVMITDVRPAGGVPYSMIMVGGSGSEVGADGAGGVASINGCAAIERGISFAFTDQIDIFAGEAGGSRVDGMCWIIAQETAHNFSLDHEFAFLDDMRSACNDPMTYRDECGGQKFYRNKIASCGEFAEQGPRQCRCGGSQNSHQSLLNTFGPGTSLIGPPTVAVTTPAASSQAANSLPANIVASAGSARGVNRVELYLNNYKWLSVNGVPFGRTGQPNPSAYGLMPPTNQLPDSVYDIVVKAYDDLEIVSESAPVTVTKGAAGGCASAATCLAGQKCEVGKCFWDPPAGEVGDDCTFPQFCKTGICSNSVIAGDTAICTQVCIPGVVDSCPMGLECVQAGNNGVCFLPQGGGGGCCSSSTQTPWAPFAFATFVIGFVVLRRRPRSAK